MDDETDFKNKFRFPNRFLPNMCWSKIPDESNIRKALGSEMKTDAELACVNTRAESTQLQKDNYGVMNDEQFECIPMATGYGKISSIAYIDITTEKAFSGSESSESSINSKESNKSNSVKEDGGGKPRKHKKKSKKTGKDGKLSCSRHQKCLKDEDNSDSSWISFPGQVVPKIQDSVEDVYIYFLKKTSAVPNFNPGVLHKFELPIAIITRRTGDENILNDGFNEIEEIIDQPGAEEIVDDDVCLVKEILLSATNEEQVEITPDQFLKLDPLPVKMSNTQMELSRQRQQEIRQLLSEEKHNIESINNEVMRSTQSREKFELELHVISDEILNSSKRDVEKSTSESSSDSDSDTKSPKGKLSLKKSKKRAAKVFKKPPKARKRRSQFIRKLPTSKIDDFELQRRVETMAKLLSQAKYREKMQDITIKVNDERFKCCRFSLVLTSRFFREQLSAGNLEPGSTLELELNGVSLSCFVTVLDWMHTTEIDLNLGNIGEVLYLSEFLGVDSLAVRCQGMIDVLRKHNGDAVNLYEYAALSNLKTVAAEAAELASENFLKLTNRRKFLEYTFEQVSLLFSLDYLNIHSELEVFIAIWKWINHYWDERKQYKDSLIYCVDFDNMTSDEIEVLAAALIEEDWKEENPLTWGTDGYVVENLIRGLLENMSKNVKAYSRKVQKRKRKDSTEVTSHKSLQDWINESEQPPTVNKDRKKRMSRTEAATRIQAVVRGHRARRYLLYMHGAAIMIQKIVRGFITRRKLNRMRLAATVLYS